MVDKKKMYNRIETQKRLLKGWFGSSNLQLITSNVITVDQVNCTREITFRETVTVLSRRQGYLSWSCKKKNAIQTVAHFLKLRNSNSRCGGLTNSLNKLLNLKK